MPFGISLRDFILGILFAYFVVPMITGAIGNRSNKTPAQTAAY